MSFTQERISVHQDRVADAYQYASKDLQAIWEDVQAFDKNANEAIDLVNKEIADRYMDESEKLNSNYKQAIAEWMADDAAYLVWKANDCWFKGPAPLKRHPYVPRRMFPVSPIYLEHIKTIQFTPESLKLKADVAQASLEPLKLSPKEVEDMISWENGSNIQKIKDAINKKEGSA